VTVTVDISGPCPWTYQLDVDDARQPSVLVVARCLNPSDCVPVYSNVTVERRNSSESQVEEFAVACRPKSELHTTTEQPTTTTYPECDYDNDYVQGC